MFHVLVGKDITISGETQKKAFASAYAFCEKNGIDKTNIKVFRNESELRYFQHLLAREQLGEIKIISVLENVLLTSEFRNAKGEIIPPYKVRISFKFQELKNNDYRIIYIIENLLDLKKHLILEKTIWDMTAQTTLEITYFNGSEWQEWKIGEYKEIAQTFRKETHKKNLAEMQEIRERERYDRLLLLREQGRITPSQSKELYRLERIFKNGKKT